MLTLGHVESDVTAACQCNCVGCNAFVPTRRHRVKELQVQPEALAEDLVHFGRVAHVKRYALIGGEPTLHPQLEQILRVANASEIADELEVWSNGIRVAKMPAWFFASIDRLVVSAYPGKLTDEDIAAIRGRCEDTRVEFELRDERTNATFRQLLEKTPTDDRATQRKYDRCWNRGKCYVLDRGYFFRCCTSPFIPEEIQGRPFGSDGIAVAGITEAALEEFLARPEFMESCRACTGLDKGRPIPWREVKTPEAWKRASAGLLG